MKRIAVLVAIVLAAARPAAADGGAGEIDASDLSGGGMYPDGTRMSEFTNEMSGLSDQMSSVAGGVSNGLSQISQLTNMFGALTDLDQALQGHITDDHSGPEVPTSCGTGSNAGCAECYARAYREVNFTRNTLERLRTIYARTMTFITSAESFGDSTSGIHGVSGLSWQYARGSVEQAKTEFTAACRTKYDGLIQNMRHALDMVADCERTNFNNPDWYNRYGFMYYNFIKEAYAIH